MIKVFLYVLGFIFIFGFIGCNNDGNSVTKTNTDTSQNITKYQLNISSFGDGTVSDSLGNKLLSRTQSTSSHSYDKDSDINLIAVPENGYIIDSWDGCNQISDDLRECKISLLQNAKSVHVNFITTSIEVTSNFIDLSGTTTEYFSDTIIKALWEDSGTEALVKSVKVDDYITGNARNGFLKRVTAITISNNYRLFTIEDASLTDVIESGATMVSRAITYEDIDTSVQSRSFTRGTRKYRSIRGFTAINGIWLEKQSLLKPDTFIIKFGDMPKSIQRGINLDSAYGKTVDLGSGISATGVLEFKIDSSLGVDIDGLTLKEFSFINNFEFKESVDITYAKEVVLEKKILLGKINLKDMVFMIGLVPVYIQQDINIYIGVDGNLEAALTVSSELSQKFKSGFIYNDGEGFSPIIGAEISSTFALPKITGTASMKGYLQPQYDMKFYGAVGPSFIVQGYAKQI